MLQPFLRLTGLAIFGACLLPAVVVVCYPIIQGSSLVSAETATVVVLALLGALLARAKNYVQLRNFALTGCLAALPVFLLLWNHLGYGDSLFAPDLALAGYLLLLLWSLSRIAMRAHRDALESLSLQQAEFLDRLPDRNVNTYIALAAAISLFLELAVIRWQTTVLEFFAFYKNFGLLSCFAGLGLGYALSNRKAIPLVLVAFLLSWQMLVMIGLGHGLPEAMLQKVAVSPIPEQLKMGIAPASQTSHYVAIYLLLSVVFLITALAFIPVGQLCGRLMNRRSGLKAYGLNLLGSFAGVAFMHGVSFLWTPPVVWFAICFGGLLLFLSYSIRSMLVGAAGILAAIIILCWPVSFKTERIYSPYQLIEREQSDRGLMEIKVAGLYFQTVHDLSLSNANRSKDPKLAIARRYYELPYSFLPRPGTIAIVGSGSGNDVAAALRMGARQVTAIEIDPAILALGEAYHPESPYQDSRVIPIVNDARSFLRNTDDKFDMIVYGLLDSHAVLSATSSVRLDSFVYTLEGLREARQRLNPGGIISLSFCLLSPEQGRKIFLMLQEAFDGRPPLCIYSVYGGATTFLHSDEFKLLATERVLQQPGFRDLTREYANPELEAEMSTDDWPFFYMPRRVYPVSYLVLLGLIVLLTGGLVRSFVGQRPRFNHLVFFFLGAGFMLIEAKGITELGLAFGNTWQVIGFIIMGILIMAYFANLAVEHWQIRKPLLPFLLLAVSLLGGYFVARSGGFSSTAAGRLATLGVLTCPIFFSGILFSTCLASVEDVSSVMAINLLGAIFGGMLEYNSMYFGFQFLYLLALALYGLAWLSAKVTPMDSP